MLFKHFCEILSFFIRNFDFELHPCLLYRSKEVHMYIHSIHPSVCVNKNLRLIYFD